MARALVTGGAGQDGRYLGDALLAAGTEVHVLVRDRSARVSAGAVVHEADLRDVATVRRLLLDLRPQQVFNLAAASSVAGSWADPVQTSSVNGTAAIALLDATLTLASRGVDARFVQASSAEIFGHGSDGPQDETSPIRPVNPYGAAKAQAHFMVDAYRARGLHASSLILFNHESPRRPPTFVTRKITAAVAAISLGRADRLVLGNLDATRDWGWAPDYVDAMVAAAAAPAGGDYVVATGQGRSVREFVGAAMAHVGITDWEPLVTTDPAFVRPADVRSLVGDAGKARRELGWRPTVTFSEMVARMVEADVARARIAAEVDGRVAADLDV